MVLYDEYIGESIYKNVLLYEDDKSRSMRVLDCFDGVEVGRGTL